MSTVYWPEGETCSKYRMSYRPSTERVETKTLSRQEKVTISTSLYHIEKIKYSMRQLNSSCKKASLCPKNLCAAAPA